MRDGAKYFPAYIADDSSGHQAAFETFLSRPMRYSLNLDSETKCEMHVDAEEVVYRQEDNVGLYVDDTSQQQQEDIIMSETALSGAQADLQTHYVSVGSNTQSMHIDAAEAQQYYINWVEEAGMPNAAACALPDNLGTSFYAPTSGLNGIASLQAGAIVSQANNNTQASWNLTLEASLQLLNYALTHIIPPTEDPGSRSNKIASRYSYKNLLLKCRRCNYVMTKDYFPLHDCFFNKTARKPANTVTEDDDDKGKLKALKKELDTDKDVDDTIKYNGKKFKRDFDEIIIRTMGLLKGIQKCGPRSSALCKKFAEKTKNILGHTNMVTVKIEDDEIADTDLNKMEVGNLKCSYCERKFVYSSRLYRHMEKHVMNVKSAPQMKALIAKVETDASVLGTLSQAQVSLLDFFFCCDMCGRLFHNAEDIMQHLSDVHYNERDDVQLQLEPQIVRPEPNIQNMDQDIERDLMALLGGDDYEEQIPMKKIKNSALPKKSMQLEHAIIRESSEQCATSTVSFELFFKLISLNHVLQCERCEFIFANRLKLLEHLDTHAADEIFTCQNCGVHTRSAKDLQEHRQIECLSYDAKKLKDASEVLKFFICNRCNASFARLYDLLEHRHSKKHFLLLKHRQFANRVHKCEYCGALIRFYKAAVKHYQSEHTQTIKVEPIISNAGGSIIAPPKSRHYLCDICGKTYTQSSHLSQHMRFHKGLRPFSCSVDDCERTFTIRSDLNDHVRKVHTGERPYHCTICNKRFLTGSVFYQHRLIHRGERRYECEVCQKRFYRTDALKNHQRIHTGEKPFECPFCTKYFRQRGDRDKHVRARHSMLTDNARVLLQMQKTRLEYSECLDRKPLLITPSTEIDAQ